MKQSTSLAVKRSSNLAVKQSSSLGVKWSTSLAVKQPLSLAVKWCSFVLFWRTFGLDVCGVHSVCSVYEVSGLVAFVAPMGHWDWTLVAFTALIAFMGIGVGASTAFVLFMECLG